jgi:hypothetical protein
MKLEFSRHLKKNNKISNFWKIRPVEAELFHANEQTDRHMTELIVAFRNFVNAPKQGG